MMHGGTERTRTVIGLVDNQVPHLSATVPCNWVGRRELNPQLPQSQCGALPLSYNPHKLAGMTRLELANQLIENQSAFHFAFIPIGTRGGIRTHTVQSLNLSSPASWTTRVKLVLPEGFEPSTTRLSTVRVYQLRHDSMIGYGGRTRTYVNEFQRLAPFRLGHSVSWWTWHDLNVRPRPSQSRALIPLSYRSNELAEGTGVEPASDYAR